MTNKLYNYSYQELTAIREIPENFNDGWVVKTSHLHEAALEGYLDEIKPEYLTLKSLTIPAQYGKTSLHKAAQTGNLWQIPSHVLKDLEPLLAAKDDDGRNLFHDLKREVETSKEQISIPKVIIEHFNNMKMLLSYDNEGTTVIHGLAAKGKLDLLPPKIREIGHKILFVPDNKHQYPLHYATNHNRLSLVPQTFLTLENLITKDEDGNTPLHNCSGSHCIQNFPKKVITQEVFRKILNKENQSILGNFIRDQQISQIPIHILDSYVPYTREQEDEFLKELEENQSIKNALRRFKQKKKVALNQTTIPQI